MSFWGNLAFFTNFSGFQILDISRPTRPRLITEVACDGPQNDSSVWDTDGNGAADLLILSVEQTLSGPECGAARVPNDDRTGWHGLRFFDVSNPGQPRMVGSLYQDCGSHMHTVVPRSGRLLVLNSALAQFAGPTCGPVRGPEAGRDPLHGVVQVVEVPTGRGPVAAARGAREIKELPVVYPGDPDNRYWAVEHNFPGLNPTRACHDIVVFLELRLFAAACAEQLQMWRMGRDGLPITTDPVWVFDQPNADFWDSTIFSWDGKVVAGMDFSSAILNPGLQQCPGVTTLPDGRVVGSGNLFFLDTRTGKKLSEFALSRTPNPSAYCSAGRAIPIPMPGRRLLTMNWYGGGVDVIDFADPTRPREVAFHARADSNDWSGYWYERNPDPRSRVVIYGGGPGFKTFTAGIHGRRVGFDHLNPQTLERVIGR